MREQERGWGAVVAVWTAATTLALVALAVWWSTTLNSESAGGWDEESSGETLRDAGGCRMSGVPAGERPKLDQWQGEGEPPDRCPTEAEQTSAGEWRYDHYIKCENSRHEMSAAVGAFQLTFEEMNTPSALVGPADMEHYTRLTVSLWDELLSSIEALRDCGTAQPRRVGCACVG